MGWNIDNFSEDNCKFEILTIKKFSHTCRMCGYKFRIVFTGEENEQSYFECGCGYTRINIDDEKITTDNHNIPKEEWLRRASVNKFLLFHGKSLNQMKEEVEKLYEFKE
jgi:hypothetical protein